MGDKSTYSTRDLYLASFLRMKDIDMIEVKKDEKNGRPTCTFIFQYDTFVQTLIDTFYDKKVLVEPLQYMANQKELKNYIYNNQNGKSE